MGSSSLRYSKNNIFLENKFFLFVLLIAANLSQVDIVKSLVEAKNQIELNIQDLFGCTPLFYGNFK
jgi:hypothetical protein